MKTEVITYEQYWLDNTVGPSNSIHVSKSNTMRELLNEVKWKWEPSYIFIFKIHYLVDKI